MEEIEKVVPDIPPNSFDTDFIHLVELTHILNPFDFYVRPVKYKSIIQDWESMETKIKPARFNIQDLVIFNLGYLRGGRKYIRGRITRISKVNNFLTCDVFAIDYGFKEKSIPMEYVWECSQELANIPPLAYNCRLANCYPMEPRGFTSETNEAIKDFIGGEPVKMKFLGKKPNKILVDLINSNKESIAILLAIDGYSTIGLSSDEMARNPIIRGKRIYFHFKELKIGETLHVRVQSGNSLNGFYVARVSDYNKHLQEIDIISFYARRESSLLPLHLVTGRLVCVKIDKENKYERAFIKKVTKPNESAIVQLVDWGRDEEFNIDKMKYMHPQCLRTPVLSIYCKCEENQAWDNGLGCFLSPGYEFNITIKSLGHNFKFPNKVNISALPVPDNNDDVRALPDNIFDE
ncbi:uncharacterized protein LOC124543234 [Vanessa cardui]|uniref:uncharacterized protein LOC124543234 n=1 Tax=Vanessa cardui TaxID=171605 RepID=UPI001F13D8E9|nr:uncharacterized protein LOC124543234 [Vanessa cardui]